MWGGVSLYPSYERERERRGDARTRRAAEPPRRAPRAVAGRAYELTMWHVSFFDTQSIQGLASFHIVSTIWPRSTSLAKEPRTLRRASFELSRKVQASTLVKRPRSQNSIRKYSFHRFAVRRTLGRAARTSPPSRNTPAQRPAHPSHILPKKRQAFPTVGRSRARKSEREMPAPVPAPVYAHEGYRCISSKVSLSLSPSPSPSLSLSLSREGGRLDQ